MKSQPKLNLFTEANAKQIATKLRDFVISRTILGRDYKNYRWTDKAPYAQSTIDRKRRQGKPYPETPNLKDTGKMLAAFYVKLTIKPHKVSMFGMECVVDGAVLSYGFKGQEANAMYDRYRFNALGASGVRKNNKANTKKEIAGQTWRRPPRDFLGMAVGEWLMKEKRLASTITTMIAVKNRRGR